MAANGKTAKPQAVPAPQAQAAKPAGIDMSQFTPDEIAYIKRTIAKVEKARKAHMALAADKNIPTIFIRDDGFHAAPPELKQKQ
jgi:hypothetical protein